MSEAEAVRARIEALSAWAAELTEHFDDALDRVVPFGYSPELHAAMALHGIGDPDRAWVVFDERIDALTDLLGRL